MGNVLKTECDINNYLVSRDPNLKKLINICKPIEIELSTNYFASLANSIVGQQLSNKVTDVIWGRVVRLMDGNLIPESILSIETEKLRQIGVSYSKISYLKNLSDAVINNRLCFEDFDGMEDNEIVKTLTSIKGIGNWTAEMFLIFSLGRLDVFSLGDGGLQRAIKWLYQLDEIPTKNQLIQISEIWSPYRTLASLYLWQAIDKDLIGSEI